jgi:hypothetical protein
MFALKLINMLASPLHQPFVFFVKKFSKGEKKKGLAIGLL